MPSRLRCALLTLIIALGIGLRFWGLQFGLPHDFARPDEEKIVGPALGMVQGDLNPHLFLYPSLFTYVTAGVYALQFGIERAVGATTSVASFVAHASADPSSALVVARVLAAAAGVATIAALYGATREWFSERAALAAAAFCAVAFLHVRDSHFGVTDVPVTLLTVCAFWAAVRCARRGATLRRVAIAGLLSGLAASTKYNAALVVLPALVAIGGDAWLFRRDWKRVSGAVALLGTCLVLGFLVGTPYALLDRPAFLADFSIQRRTAFGEFHSIILDAARRITGERGWTHHFTFSLRYGLGVPLLAAGVTGACWLAVERPRHAAVVLSFPIAFYAAMGVSDLVYARWIVPLVPFLCLTAGFLVDRAAELAGSMIANRRAPAAAAAAVTILIAAPTAAQSVKFDRLIAKTDSRVLGARWIETRFPAGATLYQTGRPYGYVQPRPSDRYSLRIFDERSGLFQANEQSLDGAPDLIVVLDSPLVVFNHVPDGLGGVIAARYELQATFTGIASANPSDRAIYDQQDAFYVPFTDFAGVKRPGPTVRIFQRRR